jgi:hypothetical protein
LEDFMPSPAPFLGIVACAAALIALQSPLGMARAGENARPGVQAFAVQPSAVTDMRGAGRSTPGSGSNTATGSKPLQQDISSEIDLATGDGQQRSALEGPDGCGRSKPVCRPQGHQE